VHGAGIELGKILTVVHLHRSWREVGWFSRVFYIVVIGALTIITSCEVLGFLSQQYAGSTRAAATIEARLTELNKEAEILQSHISVVDQTIAGLPAGYVTKRFREREAAEYDTMRDRLLEIKPQKASELKASKIANEAYSAPIFAASRIFGLNPEKTISVFVLILVMVLESLSIGLAFAVSHVWRSNLPLIMAGAAQKSAKAAHVYTIELKEIAQRHNLKMEDIAEITGRKQAETVEGWLNEKPLIPIKALRLLRRWAASSRP